MKRENLQNENNVVAVDELTLTVHNLLFSLRTRVRKLVACNLMESFDRLSSRKKECFVHPRRGQKYRQKREARRRRVS